MTDDREAREIEAKLAEEYLAGAVLAREVSHQALRLALQQIADGTVKDPARMAVNAATTSGILLDKRLVLQERPTQFVGVDLSGSLNQLARRVGLTESTAIEIPDAEVVEPKTQPLLGESARPKRARARAKSPAAQPAD